MKFWQSRYNPDIKLSRQDLLEISKKISREFSPVAASAFPELVLLPVDPFHLYAYWNLGGNNIDNQLNDYANFQLTLRIYWHFNENHDFYNTKQWFDVAVNRIQHQQKVYVPNDETFYSAVIGMHYPDDSFAAYAYSNIIQVPRIGMVEENKFVEQAKEFKPPEEGKGSSLTKDNDTVLNAFIMKDKLHPESTEAPKNLKHKSTATSYSEISHNASGLGIKT